jgi:hypothetical protein
VESCYTKSTGVVMNKIDINILEEMVGGKWRYRVDDSENIFESIDNLDHCQMQMRVLDMELYLKEEGYDVKKVFY